ncbi:MAG: BatD family protein [Bacteroidales bacterium]|nr:BatD family protein [Bacteroidales bacterium]
MKRLVAIIMLLAAAFTLRAQTSIRVDAPNLVAVSEQFNVTFVIEGEDSPTDFQWSPGDDFQLVWGPQRGSSTSVTIVNGKRSRTSQTTFTYVLMPKKEGKFTLPTATAKVGGKEISSSGASVEVVSAQSGGGSQGSSGASGGSAQESGSISDDDLFLRLTLSRTSAVVGEPINVSLKLYQRVSVAGFEDARFPSFNGFWSQEIQAPTSIEFTRENYNGSLYNSAILRTWTIIPQQSGDLVIEPAELVCLVNVRVATGGGSIFDSFFQDDYRTLRKRIYSKSYTVKVSPLPSGAPASFGGGVGTFTMNTALSASSLNAHDAGSLKVTVSGSGNVYLLEAPKVQFPPDFEVYDVKISDSPGAKVFEYPFIPRSPGDFEIGPVEYSYFDINTRKYVTLKSDVMPLSVARGTNTDSPNAGVINNVSRRDVRNLDSDIRYIVTKKPKFNSAGSVFAFGKAFWALAAALLLLWAAAFVALRRIGARRADVALTKNRKATSLARKKLAQAGIFLDKNLYTAFYEELHKALLGFVGDKLNMDLADMSKENISAELCSRGTPAQTAQEFTDLLDACEYARYSPDSGHEAMSEHYKKSLEVISEIDNAMKVNRKTRAGGAAAAALLLLLLPGAALRAQDSYPDSLWNAGTAAYSDGRWDDALQAWSGIESLGVESADLYYNLGNAYFKTSDYAHAILFYERALKLDPSSADIKHNLQYAQEFIQDNIETVPEFFLAQWFHNLSRIFPRDVWAVLFLVLLAAALGLSLLFALGGTPARRKAGFFGGIAALLLCALCFSFARVQYNQYINATDAIITRAVTSVKSSPDSGSAKDLFVLHAGSKVRILDSVGEWMNVELPDGRQGWLPEADMEVI